MKDATRVSALSKSERVEANLDTAIAALKSAEAILTGGSAMPAPISTPPTAPPPKPATSKVVARKNGRKRGEDLILTDVEERAHVARFIRLIRSDYWLSNFLKVVLRMDGSSPDQVPIKDVRKQLDNAAELDDLVNRVQFIGRSGYWAEHPAMVAIREEWDDVFDYRTDRKINDLIDSAKGAARK